MEEDYVTAITQASALLADLIRQRHDLIDDALQFDVIVQGYLQNKGTDRATHPDTFLTGTAPGSVAASAAPTAVQ